MGRRQKKVLFAAVAAGVLLIGMAGIWMRLAGAVSDDMGMDGAASLRASILDASLQCYAVEGAYPESVAYLEAHYGIRIDHGDYYVSYDVFGSNVPPSVQVIRRN